MKRTQFVVANVARAARRVRCSDNAASGLHRRAGILATTATATAVRVVQRQRAATTMPLGVPRSNGKKKRWWFGYLVHLIVDASYELPVAFEVTPASYGEQPEAQRLLDQMQERHPDLLEQCERLSADKGYDDSKLIGWGSASDQAIIDIRNCWKDGENEENGVVTKLVSGQENVIYTGDGQVCLHVSADRRAACHGLRLGFERDRNTLKYRCPARYSGITCEGMEQCPVANAVRIKLEEDRRVFTPVARSSYVWQDYYDERSAVERVNSAVGGRVRVRPPVHPRADEDAAAHDAGVDDHAGGGLGTHPGRPADHLRSLVERLTTGCAPVTSKDSPPPAKAGALALSCTPMPLQRPDCCPHWATSTPISVTDLRVVARLVRTRRPVYPTACAAPVRSTVPKSRHSAISSTGPT